MSDHYSDIRLLFAALLGTENGSFTIGATVYGVDDKGNIWEGPYRGIYCLPGSGYGDFIVETEDVYECFPMNDNRVFKTRAEAEARARDFQ